jgi:hypothetical protein
MAQLPRSIVVLFALTFAPAAFAQPYHVETTVLETRSEADEACAKAVAAGMDARVVRSFRRGEGWVFTVRVEGVQQRDEAAKAAAQLSELSGASVQVFATAGRDVLPVEELAVTVAGDPIRSLGPAESVEGAPSGLAPDARAEGGRLLAAAVAAHGGGRHQPAGPGLDSWDPVHFRFERSARLGDETVRVWHDYWRAGECVRLEVRILEGEGTDSTTLVCGDRAQLLVGGELHEPGAGPSAEALALFEPAEVLDQALGFARWEPDRDAWSVPALEGYESLDWFALEQQEAEAELLVALDGADRRVRQLLVRTEGVELRWSYADYQEIEGGLVLPLRFESQFDGQVRERVTVLALERPLEPDAALFELAPPQNP